MTGSLGAVALGAATGARAHGGAELGGHPWDAWNVTVDVAVPSGLFLAVYAVGAIRRRAHEATTIARDAAFGFGVACVFLALASPIDPVAERSFVMHQVQHLLLRMVGPMLIALSAPQAVLLRGLPEAVRSGAVAPVIAGGGVRRVFAVLTQPAVATALFVGVFYFWQIPRFHNLSILNEAVHYAMHASLLITGLLFWWRVFDHRPPPQGARYGVRLMMLWLMVLSNIAIGAYLTLKTVVLYPAYDQLGRVLQTNALADEQLGAVTIWVPGSMMGLIAVLIVIHTWARAEARWDERGHPAPAGADLARAPRTAAERLAEQRARNRRLGLGLLSFVLAVFASAISVGLLSLLGPPPG